jgi:cytochrome P450
VGFIKETLRFSNGIPGRLTRVVPRGGLTVPSAGKTIPAGSVVGMSHLMIHMDPNLFNSPQEFKPERWLEDGGLDHWLVSFSKGTRDCIGKK